MKRSLTERIQTNIQLKFESIFSKWADIVSRRTKLVFIVSSIVFIGLSFGNIF